VKIYPLFKPHVVTQSAVEKLSKVLDSGYLNEGVQVTEFKKELANLFGLSTRKLTLTNSCTSALTLALKASGVVPGSKVITTAMTCVATNTPIVTAGARPVWADVDPETGMLTVESINKVLTPEVKAVVVVAWAGSPPELDVLYDFCQRKNVKLILDAAHAFGAKYHNKQIHHWADMTCYSFQAIKHITTGDGGAIVCNSEESQSLVERLKWFGLDRDSSKDEKGDWKGQQWDVDILDAGYKFNMNNISAAIGLSQIPHVERILNTHKANAKQYDKLFENDNVVRPLKQYRGAESSYWVYTVRLRKTSSNMTRDHLVKVLNQEGVNAGLVHVPNHDYTTFKEYYRFLPKLKEFSDSQFSIPCGWWLTSADITTIYNKIQDVLRLA
jgi:dTDP-4-amino-4,6-dideoxygalactose transaminase